MATHCAPRSTNSGSALKGKEAFGFADLSDLIGDMAPVAQDVLKKLSARIDELQVTLARVNDLLSDRNRANVASTLANLNGMLAEDRPKVGNIPVLAEKVPRVLKLAAGDYCYAVEAARGRVLVRIVSDNKERGSRRISKPS